jgi:hypothetical protein
VSIANHTPKSARIVRVIEVVAARGAGVINDPIRQVVQYWSFDGTLLAEDDPDALGRGVNQKVSGTAQKIERPLGLLREVRDRCAVPARLLDEIEAALADHPAK